MKLQQVCIDAMDNMQCITMFGICMGFLYVQFVMSFQFVISLRDPQPWFTIISLWILDLGGPCTSQTTAYVSHEIALIKACNDTQRSIYVWLSYIFDPQKQCHLETAAYPFLKPRRGGIRTRMHSLLMWAMEKPLGEWRRKTESSSELSPIPPDESRFDHLWCV